MRGLIFPLRTEHPFGERCGSQVPWRRGMVAEPQARDLDGVAWSAFIERNKDSQLLTDTMAVVFEHAVALSVPGAIGVGFANGQSGWRPDGAGVLIPKVDCLRSGVADRIVLPSS